MEVLTFRHNFRPDLLHHENLQRAYALGDEGGLVTASWPKSGRPRAPFIYSDEVWTGIEYQVAAQLIFESFVEEGLTVVRAARARQTGEFRSPWDDIEAGHPYARSLAAWGLLIAASGSSTTGSPRRCRSTRSPTAPTSFRPGRRGASRRSRAMT